MDASAGSTDVRLEDLPSASDTKVLIWNNFNGRVSYWNDLIFQVCNNSGTLPIWKGSGQLNCSPIYDDGTSVGNGVTSGFSYSSNPQFQGSTGVSSSRTVKLDVADVSTATAFLATSDERLKSDIHPLKNAMEKVLAKNAKTYSWKQENTTTTKFDNLPQVGFLAQDLIKIIPETVALNENGFYSVNYNMIIPVLSEAI